MKKTWIMAMVLVMFSASIALAGNVDIDGDAEYNVGIGIDNVNTNNNSANANAQQQQLQEQQQQQQQQQQQTQDQNQYNQNQQVTNFNDMREHTAALPGISGSFMPAPPVIADGEWHQLLCQEYTVEELEYMVKSSSYTDREGFFLNNWFSSPLKETRRVKPYKGEVSSGAVVRTVPDTIDNKTLIEYEGSGAKKAPLSAIVAYAALDGVRRTGEYSMVVYYRARSIANLSGVGLGSGAAAAVSSGGSGQSGALSVGAILGYSEAYSTYVYDIKVAFVRASAAALAAAQCLPPQQEKQQSCIVQPPQPALEQCDPTIFLERIKQLEEGTKHCPNECLNNELLWKQIGDANMHLWYCTRDRKYLDCAAYAYWRSEKNFLEGVEGDRKTRTRDLKGAQDLVYWARYNWSLAIRERDGRDQQVAFAQEKGLGQTGDGTMPTGQADMK